MRPRCGLPGPLAEFAVPQGRISQIFATTIYAERFTMSDQSISVHGTAGNIAGGQGNVVQQRNAQITRQGVDLHALLGNLRAAVQQLDRQLPADQVDATQGLVKDLEEDAVGPLLVPERMHRKLRAITAFARAAGPAGSAVMDATQALHRTLSAAT